MELKKILEERTELEPKYQKLAQINNVQNTEINRHKKRLRSLQQQSYKLKYDVSSIRAQLKALEHWLKNNPNAIKAKQEKELRVQVAEQYELLSDLENVQAELAVKIEVEQSTINRMNNMNTGEDEIRARYAANVEQEQIILDQAQKRMASKNRYVTNQIKKKKTELAGFYAELESISQKMRDSVATRAGALKAEILQEQGLLENWENVLALVQDDTQILNGEIATNSLKRIAENLDTVLLRADLGSCDIAWSTKEDKTKGISAAINQQRDLLMLLENEFQEVLTF
jgi:chromosome segregation ATPase